MKKSVNVFRNFGLTALTVLLFASCEKDSVDAPDSQTEDFEVAALQTTDETDLITEEVIQVGEVVYEEDEMAASAKGGYQSGYLPDCVTITTVITSTTKEKTIDFGDGCELPNGNLLSGIIKLSYAKDMELARKTLELELQDFTFNGVAVAGSASIERQRSNENGNPQSYAQANFNAEWPDGNTADFTGQRTREWIEGFGSGFWGDNVFLITGASTFNGPAGNTYQKEVIEPLRREMACRFIVSGVLELSKNGNTASLDFGDGSCDAKGMLTKPDGSTEEIFLRRFKR